MSRIVVTGGAGFVGSHLCEALLDRGDEVVAIDDFSTGRPENLGTLTGRDRFTFVAHDITTGLDLAELDRSVDGVMNLASPASPPHYLRLALETLRVGSAGTDHALQLAHRHSVRFVQASTSEVYGDPEQHPQRETYWGHVNPVGPRSVYDEAKRYGEAIAMAFHTSLGVSVGLARIFNTYGPRLDPRDGRVVSNMLVQALSGRPLTVYGDGTQTRSFCYVDDLVRGLIALLDSDHVGPVNLGNPVEFTMLELAEVVQRVTGTVSELEYLPLPTDDPTRRRPDITLAGAVLGWQPVVPLEEGLQRSADWFRAEVAD